MYIIIICQVISSSQFKLFLELEPQLREVLQCFYDSRYILSSVHCATVQ